MSLKLSILFLLVSFSISSNAQNKNNGRPSPPMVLQTKIGSVNVTINYGAPSVKGREIWGKLVPYKKIWRTGANEATTFECDGDLKVEGQLLPKGKYALFTIPEKSEWTIIFNRQSEQWGTYEYKEESDVLRVKTEPVKLTVFQEQLLFSATSEGIAINWEALSVPITINQ